MQKLSPWLLNQALEFNSIITEKTKSIPIVKGLHKAISYALSSPGKRLRPLLIYANGYSLNIDKKKLHDIALAIEYIHTYSLVHDDLPGMDDDHMRRGIPSTHIAFDHATAILVGDALQSMAYETIINSPHLNSEEKINVMQILLAATGSTGMISGQFLDCQKQNNITLPMTEKKLINPLKTGLFLQACFTLPLLGSVCTCHKIKKSFTDAGSLLGLGYQYLDDSSDCEEDVLLDLSDCKLYYSEKNLFANANDKALWLLNKTKEKIDNIPNNKHIKDLLNFITFHSQ